MKFEYCDIIHSLTMANCFPVKWVPLYVGWSMYATKCSSRTAYLKRFSTSLIYGWRTGLDNKLSHSWQASAIAHLSLWQLSSAYATVIQMPGHGRSWTNWNPGFYGQLTHQCRLHSSWAWTVIMSWLHFLSNVSRHVSWLFHLVSSGICV